ncbi:unnamed protein product [Victoria cruziana]
MADFVPAALMLADFPANISPTRARNGLMMHQITVASFGQGAPLIFEGKQGSIKYPQPIAFSTSFRQSNQESRAALIQSRVSTFSGPTFTSDGIEQRKLRKEAEWQQLIEKVRLMINSMGDGEISISAYDTAWVGMVAEEDEAGGNQRPRFPSCLEWIAQNQHPDGSWGESLFSIYDRVINTLACVIALKTWNHSPHKWEKALLFLQANIHKLEEEAPERMTIAFEMVFFSLLEIAKALPLDLPYDSHALCKIHERQQLKLKRIPKGLFHSLPTPLLFSLEGMQDLDWEKLKKHQCENGSFLHSPSSTAFAFMQTKDEGCLRYLRETVARFNGGVPNIYPVELFERIWGVDRLERLGVAQYFESEINIKCLDYLYRQWTDRGIFSTKDSNVEGMDETCMGFRLLRKHGYQVSTDALKHFEKDGEFFCLAGQSNEAISVICNLNRASQLAFPSEKILEAAKVFSHRFLREKQEKNQLIDKWHITKNTPGEVEYTLDFPMYASLPRVETRFYLDIYGGEHDIWIGKSFFRMPNVDNETYLELAKIDFNRIQSVHRSEIRDMLKWYKECNFGKYGLSRRILVESYFLASSVIYEPERASERLAWTRSLVLMEAVSKHLSNNKDGKNQILEELQKTDGSWSERGLVDILIETLKVLSLEAMDAHAQDISQLLHQSWVDWIRSWHRAEGTSGDAIMESNEGELLVKIINLCGGRYPSQQLPLMELFAHPTHARLTNLINSLSCNLHRIYQLKLQKINEELGGNSQFMNPEVEYEIKELIQFVFNGSQELDKGITRTFLDVAKTFCYAAYCSVDVIEDHILKVLFERV